MLGRNLLTRTGPTRTYGNTGKLQLRSSRCELTPSLRHLAKWRRYLRDRRSYCSDDRLNSGPTEGRQRYSPERAITAILAQDSITGGQPVATAGTQWEASDGVQTHHHEGWGERRGVRRPELRFTLGYGHIRRCTLECSSFEAPEQLGFRAHFPNCIACST